MKLLTIGLALGTIFFLGACGEDDKSSTKPTVTLTEKMTGSWRSITQEAYVGTTATIEAEKVSTLKFRDNGKYEFEFELYGEDRNDIIAVWEEDGVWSMDDNVLIRTAGTCYQNNNSITCDTYFPTVVSFEEESLVLTSEVVLRHLNIDTTYVWVYEPLIIGQ